MPQSDLDGVEREALAYLVGELEVGRTHVLTDAFLPFLQSREAGSRLVAILKHFEALAILTPEHPPGKQSRLLPLVGGIIPAYWRIEGKAVRLHREVRDRESAGKAIHNADFTMVDWFGTEYLFALGVQSSAVRALWAEWEQSGLGLHQDTIREAIDTERDHFRMDTAFRNHPALGTMIQRCGDGRYKLARPSTPPDAATPKTKRNLKRAPQSRRRRV
jgi:hypothetical protein